MGWAIAAGWLAVSGTTLLTLGTGAQAWASLAEFKELMQTASATATTALKTTLGLALLGGGLGPDMPSWWNRYIPGWLALVPEMLIALAQPAWLVFFAFRTTITKIRTSGGDEAVELVRFLRSAGAWAVLMTGSALALTAAVIQLVLAYQ